MNLPHLINTADIPKENIQTKKHDLISPETGMMYMVVKGAVIEIFENAEEKSYIKRLLGPGDIFPLYIPQTARDLNLTYQTTVCGGIVELPVQEFIQLQQTSPDIAKKYMQYVRNILQITEQKVADKVFLSSEERIIKLLIQLAENPQFTTNWHGQKDIRSGLIQEQLASLALCSRQVFTQVLKKLKDKKMLSYDRARIFIYDVQKLKDYIPGAT